jgi:hypothetical protein
VNVLRRLGWPLDRYNLVDRSSEDELDYCEGHGTGAGRMLYIIGAVDGGGPYRG